jgi:undecaprenyl-diphosphatase
VDPLTHYLQIVLLGIVEGVTEFLPISSTGHLLIAEHLVLGTQEPDIFNVVIQAGAILAVVFIYWHKLMDLFGNLDKAEARGYLLKIFLAFVVTSGLYLVAAKLMGHHKLTESLANVAWATLIGGVVIYLIEYLAKNLYPHDEVSWFESILVGAAQVVAAIFPGASRSGSTIMAGLAVGMKRPAVTEFSFLVGIPTMFAASVYATYKGRADLHGIGHQLILDTALGFVVSMIVAFFVVKWLLRFVQSHTFNGFATYRVLLGGGLLIGLYTHAIPDMSNDVVNAQPVPTAMVVPVSPAVASPGSTPPAASADSAAAAPVSPMNQSLSPASATNAAPGQ